MGTTSTCGLVEGVGTTQWAGDMDMVHVHGTGACCVCAYSPLRGSEPGLQHQYLEPCVVAWLTCTATGLGDVVLPTSSLGGGHVHGTCTMAPGPEEMVCTHAYLEMVGTTSLPADLHRRSLILSP